MSSVKVHMLNVGHGDSIILEMTSNDITYWGMVDCCTIPNNLSTPALEFIIQNNINNLEFICLSHPHHDHYSGLSKIFDYFDAKGRSIEEFWDHGLYPGKCRAFIKSENERREFDEIYDRILSLSKSKSKKKKKFYWQLNKSSPCWSKDDIKIISLSNVDDFILKAYEYYSKTISDDQKDGSISLANSLSIVLLISCDQKNILLTADATKDSINDIVKNWPKISSYYGLNDKFDIIKVPHHGSIHSHVEELWNSYTVKDNSFTLVSGGVRKNLPHGDVLRNIAENKSQIYCTNYCEACEIMVSKKNDSKLSDINMLFALDLFTNPEIDDYLGPGFGDCMVEVNTDRPSLVSKTQFDTQCIYNSEKTCQYIKTRH